MMKGKQPRVLVIVNKAMPEWVNPLKRYDAAVTAFEIFRSDKNEHIIRVDGFIPAPSALPISKCALDPVLPRWLAIESPSILRTVLTSTVRISFNSCISEWQRIDASDKVWLAPVGKSPLSLRNGRFTLLRDNDGTFKLEES